jgi:Fuc2NAc and GlcNAc transferase
MKIYFFITIVGLTLLSFALTKIIQIIARKKKIIDIPNQRSSHDTPTPRGGGLAIACIWYLLISFLFVTYRIPNNLYFALLSGIVISIVSLIDDLKNVPPFIRIAAQFVSVSASLFFLGGLQTIDLGFVSCNIPLIFNLLVIIVWVWCINLFNFMDGIDGYLGTEAVFIFLSLFLFTGNRLVLYLVPIILGFLFLNWPKARIFSGDTGSTLIGFSLMVFAIYFQNSGTISIIVPLILTGLFWMDATVTLYRRLMNREKLIVAHNKHAYQRLVRAGFSHSKVLNIGILINLFLFATAYLSWHYVPDLILLGLFLQIILVLGFIKYADSKKKFKRIVRDINSF